MPLPLVGGTESVGIAASNKNIRDIISERLTNFIIVTTVAGALLCGSLGYETIRIQSVVEAQKALVAENVVRDANDRSSSCIYTRSFVAAFVRFEKNQASEVALEFAQAPHDVAMHAQAQHEAAYTRLFADLNDLGVRACAAHVHDNNPPLAP